MIRILHLTDFHLNKRTLKDWNDFYKKAFFEKLDDLQKEKTIDLVAFTGDLIDKGGIDFKTEGDTLSPATKGFNIFQKEIIEEILKKLNLEIDRFIICPGNHDINRFADDEFDENGMKATLTSTEKVIDFIDKSNENESFKRIERIKEYKNFESELYKDVSLNKIHSMFKFSLVREINGIKVGISSLNSSWRCYGDDDFQNILLGETQLNDNLKFIQDCEVKIALIHHQLDWLCSFEKKTIKSHIQKDYDLILSGHVHEHQSDMSTGFTGSCFQNVSPSGLNQIRSDDGTFVNGFTVIDYNDSITCHYLKYNHEDKTFVNNEKIGTNGKKTFHKPKEESNDDLRIYRKAIKNIREIYYPEMNDHFIKGKNEVCEKSVKNSFIFPPIDKGATYSGEDKENLTLQYIINSPDHTLFLGPQESGKRSLLYRIIVELVDDYEIYNKVPVFIDFKEVKNKEFITIVREYTLLTNAEIERLLNNGKFVFLVDNLDYHESKNYIHQINRFHKLNSDYPLNRIIASYEHENIEILPTELIQHSKIAFSYQYIRGLRTKEIKLIMKQWLSEDDSTQQDSNLEKLVNTFTSYHLPNNALSIHLYLWSVENSDRKPINQAVLMEIYVELILEKIKEENIYTSNFDFTNKIQLISMIAEKIIKKENGESFLKYNEFYDIIYEYLKNKVGFSFDVNVIINYLLERKIFIKNKNNEIMFSHLCFIHFFVAKRMQDNSSFKKYILDEERYFNYPKEIDYYTGLVRSDLETFNLIYSRFKKVFEPMDFILKEVNPDEYFNISFAKDKKAEEIEPISRNVEIAKIKDSRPAEAEIEKQYDEQLERISKITGEIKGKSSIDFDRMMLIMCNVLKNSEGIEDLQLKKDAYNDIIKHNITYSILYTQVLIRYIIENKKLPPSVPQNVSLEYLLKNIPFHMQYSLNTHLGTKKLDMVVLNKIKRDSVGESFSNSDVEKFLSVALYSDIYGNDFDKYLRKFIKSVDTVPTQNYLLFKLTEYLYRRSKPDSDNEIMYLDLISDLYIRSQKLPKRLKESIIKDYKEKKKKFAKFIGLN
ncbi:metallophosphoesterase [Epilithonimonas hominis]|uniref:metallophosphoesterase n=1 Tax=Epilithonimonas hominis TaxID=420404 RepID=UPI00289B6040|nr:metallophosphoesterase [Epilithonimonas hominis]